MIPNQFNRHFLDRSESLMIPMTRPAMLRGTMTKMVTSGIRPTKRKTE